MQNKQKHRPALFSRKFFLNSFIVNIYSINNRVEHYKKQIYINKIGHILNYIIFKYSFYKIRATDRNRKNACQNGQ